GIGPCRIEIDKGGDDLGLAVGVNVAVARGATPAHRDHGWTRAEIELELLFEGPVKIGAVQLVDKPGEGRPIASHLDPKASAVCNGWKCLGDPRTPFEPDEAAQHEKVERRSRQRTSTKGIQIEEGEHDVILLFRFSV